MSQVASPAAKMLGKPRGAATEAKRKLAADDDDEDDAFGACDGARGRRGRCDTRRLDMLPDDIFLQVIATFSDTEDDVPPFDAV